MKKDSEKAKGEVLPGNPGIVFIPSAAAIASVLEKEGGDDGDDEYPTPQSNEDFFRNSGCGAGTDGLRK